jgi:hypothetical protein
MAILQIGKLFVSPHEGWDEVAFNLAYIATAMGLIAWVLLIMSGLSRPSANYWGSVVSDLPGMSSRAGIF